jgi:hypothetical protein
VTDLSYQGAVKVLLHVPPECTCTYEYHGDGFINEPWESMEFTVDHDPECPVDHNMEVTP